MKLKIVEIYLPKLLKITNRYLSFNSIYKDIIDKERAKVLLNYKLESVMNNIEVPIIIFLNNQDNYMDKEFLNVNQLDNLLTSISIHIEYIINIEQLILFKIFYKNYNNKLEELVINIIFIQKNKGINYPNIDTEKQDFMTKLLLINKRGSLDTQLIAKIFHETDKDLFSIKFKSSITKHFFREKRKTSFLQSSKTKNPRQVLYLQKNEKYLSIESIKLDSKLISIIHCPICAKEHKISNDIINIEENNLIFHCEHIDTQFEKYQIFKININIFKDENLLSIENSILIQFFKRNIQPIIKNNVYFIQILNSETVEYIHLKRFIKISKNKISNRLSTYQCPICNKQYFINFSEINKQNYTDIKENIFIHYKKLFLKKNMRLEFQCTHSNTEYNQYNKLSKKFIQDESLYKQSLNLVETYSGNYLDGKKVVFVLSDDFYIIDLSYFI